MNKPTKLTYSTPLIEVVQLDNEISLVLDSITIDPGYELKTRQMEEQMIFEDMQNSIDSLSMYK